MAAEGAGLARARSAALSRLAAWLPLGVLALLAVLFLGFGLRHDPHVTPAATVGKPAPLTPLAPLDGGPPRALATEATRGGPALVNLFASWCVPCAEEAPALMALKAQGVRVVGVAYKDDAAATRRFLSLRGDPFAAVLMDPDGRAGLELGASGVPETFLVAADGRIVAKHAGALSPADAEDMVERLAAAAGTAKSSPR